jgi:hydrogenase maturation protease
MTDADRGKGPVRLLGVGNVLMGDDALGPYVVRVLEAEYSFPEAVEVLDVGTPGLDFTPYLAHARAVIVIDTVRSDGPPGSLRTYTRDQYLEGPPLPRTSPHEPGIREALMATELTDSSPEEILIVGVVPEVTTTGLSLSPAVQDAVPKVIECVLSELERLGLGATQKTDPDVPDIWWEAPTAGAPE